MRTLAVASLLGIMACGSTAPPGEATKPASRPDRVTVDEGAPREVSSPPAVVHHLEDAWASGAGCTPSADPLTLRGVVQLRQFGKGTEGAILRTDAGDEWILSYRAQGVLLDHANQRVDLNGTPCTKKGQSMAGQHFDARTLSEVAE